MSEFLYCHDPLDEEAGEYLLHLGNPTALIKIVDLQEDDEIESDEFVHKTFSYETEDGDIDDYQLVFTPFSSAASAITDHGADKITGILDAAWEYWVEVLEWEDEDEE